MNKRLFQIFNTYRYTTDRRQLMQSHLHYLLLLLLQLMLVSSSLLPAAGAVAGVSSCRSYCGNITVDYPFGLRRGCGHSGFRDLLFCINGMLMLHIPSGSYRVLDIDYAYRALTLHDHSMSDCYSILRSPTGSGNGFMVEPWRSPYLEPDPDNVFLLLGCRPDSPLFQGFPGKHLPCRNVSGMGCEDYYRCPAWGRTSRGEEPPSSPWPSSPPECCAVEFGAIRSINLTRLRCEGYSSAYSVAPLRLRGPGEWSYGIRISYSLPSDKQGFCGACQATGGVCGYDDDDDDNDEAGGNATGGSVDLCICDGGAFNSTSNCDSRSSSDSVKLVSSVSKRISGEMLSTLALLSCVFVIVLRL